MTECVAEAISKCSFHKHLLFLDLRHAHYLGPHWKAIPVTMFMDPDPFQEFAYPNVFAARRAITDYLAMPLAKLPSEQREWINTLVETTLCKKEVIEQVEEYFGRRTEMESPC